MGKSKCLNFKSTFTLKIHIRTRTRDLFDPLWMHGKKDRIEINHFVIFCCCLWQKYICSFSAELNWWCFCNSVDSIGIYCYKELSFSPLFSFHLLCFIFFDFEALLILSSVFIYDDYKRINFNLWAKMILFTFLPLTVPLNLVVFYSSLVFSIPFVLSSFSLAISPSLPFSFSILLILTHSL